MVKYECNLKSGRFTMPRFITDTCVACGSCAAECPVDCISEGEIYVIDPSLCIDCGACQEVCPVDCIIEE